MGHVSVSHTSVMGVFYLLSAGVRGAKFPILFDAERSRDLSTSTRTARRGSMAD